MLGCLPSVVLLVSGYSHMVVYQVRVVVAHALLVEVLVDQVGPDEEMVVAAGSPRACRRPVCGAPHRAPALCGL